MLVEDAAAAPGVTAEGGAARPIIKVATLFAVPATDSSVPVGKEALFPPLPNESHLDAFLTIGGMIDVGVGAAVVASEVGWLASEEALLRSLARVCDALARTWSVSSASPSLAVTFLLFLAPRLPRFLVDRLRPSSGKSLSFSLVDSLPL